MAIAGSAVMAAALVTSCFSPAQVGAATNATSGVPHRSASLVSATTPGVTATTIKVGTIATLTGGLASNFDAFTPGMEAYFDMVNARGGVNGRKVDLAYNLDDGGNPTTFTQLAHTLIQQDHVFAVGVSTYWFTPGLFAQTKTPTYGYNVSGNWAGPANLFAAGGSTQDYQTGAPPVAYLIKQTKSKSVAVVSYGPAIASSYDACHADATNLKNGGVKVSYVDLDAPLSGDYTSAVQRIQETGADFVLSCMQASDDITLARAIQQYGLKVHQLWFDGYDTSLLAQYSQLMQGVYLNINGNVPFGAPKSYPGKYQGMQQYLTTMQKYEPKFVLSQEAMQGWQSAALLVAGIKAAGSDLTQQNVIAKTNQLTNFTAGGLATITNWKNAHTTNTFPGCSSFVQVKGKQFVPAVAKAPQAFVCFAENVNLKNPTLVAPTPGTPGT